MELKLIVGILAGALIGAVVGYAGKCAGGGCPLTCNPIGGIITGAVIGGLLASSFRTSSEPFVQSANVREITAKAELDQVIQSGGVVLVDFYADWCGPCRLLKPAIHRLADRYAGRVAVVGVNVDKAREAAEVHGVSSIPDVKIFKAGKLVNTFVGTRPESSYAAALDELLK